MSNSAKKDINRLAPPKIGTDEFLEDSEEIDFMEADDKIKKEPLEWKVPFDLGADLRGSIGKKGRGGAQELIPTRDFEMGDI